MNLLYPVDRVHSGIRFVSLALVALAMVLTLLFVPPLLRQAGMGGGIPLVISFFIGVVLGGALSFLAERALPGIWPSGRAIRVSDEGMALAARGEDESAIRWDDPVDVLAWAFAIPTRRAWVPKGWYCVAFRLAQGDERVIPYTFMKADDAKELPGWESFEVLIPRKEGEKDDESGLFAGQEHLRQAEEERWWVGAEVAPEAFEALLAAARARTRGWRGAGGAG